MSLGVSNPSQPYDAPPSQEAIVPSDGVVTAEVDTAQTAAFKETADPPVDVAFLRSTKQDSDVYGLAIQTAGWFRSDAFDSRSSATTNSAATSGNVNQNTANEHDASLISRCTNHPAARLTAVTLRYLYSLFVFVLVCTLSLLAVVFVERPYGVAARIGNACLYVWPIVAYVLSYHHVCHRDGYRRALRSLRKHLLSEHEMMVTLAEPAADILAQVSRARGRLKQRYRIERMFVSTNCLMIIGVWIVVNLPILIALPDVTPSEFAYAWSGVPEEDSQPINPADTRMLDSVGGWYPAFVLIASFAQITVVLGTFGLALSALACDLQHAMWLLHLAHEVQDGRLQRTWQPWLQAQNDQLAKAGESRLKFVRAVQYCVAGFVGTWIAIYGGILIATVGFYPPIRLFVFPGLHLTLVGLMASVEFKQQLTVERLTRLLGRGLSSGARRMSHVQRDLSSASALTAISGRSFPAELKASSSQLVATRFDSDGAAFSDGAVADAPAQRVATLSSISSVTRRDSANADDVHDDNGEFGAEAAAEDDDAERDGRALVLTASPTSTSSHHAIPLVATGSASDGKLSRLGSVIPSVQRTILQSESGNRYLAKGYGVRAVLVCLPRMFLDCLIFTGPMLALVALRVYLSYPFCQRDPQDIRFGRDTDKGCSTEELTYRIIESSIVAFGAPTLLCLAAARILADEPLPLKVWIPGIILEIASIAWPMIFSFLYGVQAWTDIPSLVAWVVFVLYTGWVLARLKRNVNYAYLFIAFLGLAAAFRYSSYRFLAPLYATDAYSAILVVSVIHPAVAAFCMSIIRKLMLRLVNQVKGKPHSSPCFYNAYLLWSMALSITGRFYLANIISIEQQTVTAVWYALIESAQRLSVAPRTQLVTTIFSRGNRARAIDTARFSLENGFMLQTAYIDQMVEYAGIFVAWPGSLIVRHRYNQDLRLGVLVGTFIIQVTVELVGDIMCSLWEAGVLGFRRKTALWRLHQADSLYLKHSLVCLLAAPSICAVWFQAAVLGVPSN